MSLMLYAVAEGRPRLPGEVRGLGGRAVFALPAEAGLTALVSDGPDAIAPAPDTLREYESALEQLMDTATLLPARFGTTLADADAAIGALSERRDELTAALARVRGAVEMGLRAIWSDGAAPRTLPDTSPTRGAEYLKARAERYRRAQQLAERLHAAVGDLARDRACRVLPRPQTPVSAAYLVDRDRVTEFVSRADALGEAIDDVELVCTGPWPPYSFAGGERR